ncbi:targeting protein for Xklp2-like, partial [Python bivittatus]|uniref:Targeting protein for Xklp2-like n=1 Tax=Python bivittatus TaxID=176946 RepID=A0A9F2R7W6_PYTBI
MSQETYSYDVPDICINFEDMNEDETLGVDAWFDVRSALLTTPREGMGTPGILPKALSSRANLPRAVVSPMMKSGEKDSENKEMELANEIPSNVVGSMAEWHHASQEAAAPPTRAPGRVARKLSARRKSAQRRLMAKSQAEKCTTAFASKQEPPPPKKQKMSNNQEKLGEIDLNRNASPLRAQVPVTPAALKTRGPSAKGKSTEELELEKMQQLQQEVAELRRKNEESLKAAIAGP